MQANVPKFFPRPINLPNEQSDRFLALDCDRLIAPNGPIPLPQVTHRRFVELSPMLLNELAPSTVVMLLFAGTHDALSMIETLESFGFRGNILVIAPPLPRPDLVERELRSAGPGARLILVSP